MDFLHGPSVLQERHTLFSRQRSFSSAAGFWTVLHLTSWMRVNISLYLSNKGNVQHPKGASSPLCGTANDSFQLQTAHRTDKPLRSTFIIAVKYKCDLLFSFYLLWWCPIRGFSESLSWLPPTTKNSPFTERKLVQLWKAIYTANSNI